MAIAWLTGRNEPLQGTAGSHRVYTSLTDMIYSKYFQGLESKRRMKEEKMKASEYKDENGGRVEGDTGFRERKGEG